LVEWRQDSQHQDDYESDARYREAAGSASNQFLASRYLKTLEKIVGDNRDSSICLTVTHQKTICGLEIDDSKKVLTGWGPQQG